MKVFCLRHLWLDSHNRAAVLITDRKFTVPPVFGDIGRGVKGGDDDAPDSRVPAEERPRDTELTRYFLLARL